MRGLAAATMEEWSAMIYWIVIAVALALSDILPVSVQAQNTVQVPGVLTPVPLPPQPTANPQQPNAPPKLDTFSDKAARCLHFGAMQGLQAGARDAYSRACANN
jgi:hypothetical protein